MYLSQKLLDRIEQRRDARKEHPRQLLRDRLGGERPHEDRVGLLREILSQSEQRRAEESSAAEQG